MRMSIYKHALTKYAKNPTLWVVGVLAVSIAVVLGVWVPNHFSQQDLKLSMFKNLDGVGKYITLSIISISTIATTLSIFAAIFAAFAGARMFKDEVQDGTFLTLLSKPTTRSRILLGKWFALATVTIIFTFSIAFSWIIATIALDYGKNINLSAFGAKPLSELAWIIGLILWGILLTTTMLFSSIAILISTRFSSTATIGFVITIGVLVPGTSLVTASFVETRFKSTRSSWLPEKDSVIRTGQELISSKATTELNNVIDNTPSMPQSVKDMMSQINIDGLYSRFNKQLGEANLAMSGRDNILSFGIDTEKHDPYRLASYFDLNYQLQNLSFIATERAIPDAAKAIFAKNITKLNPPLAGYNNLFQGSQLNDESDAQKRVDLFRHAYARGLFQMRRLGTEMLSGTISLLDVITPLLPILNINVDPDNIINVRQYKQSSRDVTLLGGDVDFNSIFGDIPIPTNEDTQWQITYKMFKNAMQLYAHINNQSAPDNLTPNKLKNDPNYDNRDFIHYDKSTGQWTNDYWDAYVRTSAGTPVKYTPDRANTLANMLGHYLSNGLNTYVDALLDAEKLFFEKNPQLKTVLGQINQVVDFVNGTIVHTNDILVSDDQIKKVNVDARSEKYDSYLTDGQHIFPISYSVFNKSFPKLQAAARQGILKSLESKEYIPRYTLLYVYIAISLALIPLSILVLMKKDFR